MIKTLQNSKLGDQFVFEQATSKDGRVALFSSQGSRRPHGSVKKPAGRNYYKIRMAQQHLNATRTTTAGAALSSGPRMPRDSDNAAVSTGHGTYSSNPTVVTPSGPKTGMMQTHMRTAGNMKLRKVIFGQIPNKMFRMPEIPAKTPQHQTQF